MAKYKGVVHEVYEYEVEVDAEDGAEAITKLKEIYNDDANNAGVFVADATTLLRTEFALRSRK